MRTRAALTTLSTALLLAGCGRAEPVPEREDDPALSGALAEPIMVDTDLVGQNRANSAAAMPSQDGSVPTIDGGPEAIAAARAEALELVGGPGRMREAPEPSETSGPAAAETALTAAERAAATDGLRPFCAERLQNTAMWAARMPAAFPVYPRGAVQEAAGTDSAGCALRVVEFVTPVPLDQVIDFYYTRALAAGYSARHLRRQDDALLSGIKNGAVYDIYASRLPSGNTAVDLLTSGGGR